jgi:hypothetical protein
MRTRRIETIFRVLLLIVVVVSCQTAINKMQFTKQFHNMNTLPTSAGIYHSEKGGVTFHDCAQQCSHSKDACAGFFHNDDLKSCKILKSGQSGSLDFVNQAGWNFWRTGNCRNDVIFGVISFDIS